MPPIVFDTFSRLVVVSLLWVVALTVWDIGRHPPVRLLRSAFGQLRRGVAVLPGLLRFAVGLIAALVAMGILAGALTDEGRLFSAYAIGTFLAGLTVDLLIGDDLRNAVRVKR